MNQIIIPIALAGIFLVIWLLKKIPKTTRHERKEDNFNQVRRENASGRKEQPFKENLHTTQSGNERRRFFIDVKLADNGKKFMTISELEKEVGGEKGYSLVIFDYEIEGFRKAFERSYEFMKA